MKDKILLICFQPFLYCYNWSFKFRSVSLHSLSKTIWLKRSTFQVKSLTKVVIIKASVTFIFNYIFLKKMVFRPAVLLRPSIQTPLSTNMRSYWLSNFNFSYFYYTIEGIFILSKHLQHQEGRFNLQNILIVSEYLIFNRFMNVPLTGFKFGKNIEADLMLSVRPPVCCLPMCFVFNLHVVIWWNLVH